MSMQLRLVKVRVQKIGDWNSIDCLTKPLEVAGMLYSETRHDVHGYEFCEDQVYFTTWSVTTFNGFSARLHK